MIPCKIISRSFVTSFLATVLFSTVHLLNRLFDVQYGGLPVNAFDPDFKYIDIKSEVSFNLRVFEHF